MTIKSDFVCALRKISFILQFFFIFFFFYFLQDQKISELFYLFSTSTQIMKEDCNTLQTSTLKKWLIV